MIQELFGGSNVGIIGGGGDISKLSTTPSHSPSPSSSAAGGGGAAPAENLRCPRCDSSNTKFCYYNNYNLTQPRHFCKTCRRYWTKGGALRNVPIGGGCRKNKSGATISAAVGKSSKMKSLFSETALPSNPILWAQDSSSHILSLLRANQNPNPSHIQNCAVSLKEEGNSVLFGSAHLGSDPLGPTHLPSMGFSSSSYRNQTTQGFILGNEAQNHGLQELYQRLRSSTNYYPADQNAPIILGNVASAASPILESAPVASADQLGFWGNPNLSWPTDCTNAAYP